jgi:ABC-type methionine transport system permease subunit
MLRGSVGSLATALGHQRGDTGRLLFAIVIVVIIIIVVAWIWWNSTDSNDSND